MACLPEIRRRQVIPTSMDVPRYGIFGKTIRRSPRSARGVLFFPVFAMTKFLSSRPESRDPEPREGKGGSPLETCGDDTSDVCLCDPAVAGKNLHYSTFYNRSIRRKQ